MGAVHVRTEGDVVWIVLDAPERMNAFDALMATRVADALADSTSARAVVITGAGAAFCAGGALGTLADPSVTQLRLLYTASLRMLEAVRDCPRPVIAAVNGAAAGGGNELVIACDLAIAARSATFGQTGPRVGSAPVTGGTNVLAIQVGEKRAKEWSFLCRRYTADEAFRLGLVNEVVDDEQLGVAVQRVVDELKALSPRYLEIAKVSSNVWWHSSRASFASGLEMLIQAAAAAPDLTEGADAFLEKRAPRFAPPE